ncbi:hypothetical protein [Staphylococcus equorum]|uniref:hypothetical protein n=1 Tax=Staphylococcus equorum TaxID=246432 RepID=UPI00298299DE|nr:hypothetical protein [Staphylococcus equorum]MDW5472675.1 hypothetical protein [Staphylococcus equorum]
MNYRKEMERMGWTEKQIIKRVNSLAQIDLELPLEQIKLKPEDLNKNNEMINKVEKLALNIFFNNKD